METCSPSPDTAGPEPPPQPDERGRRFAIVAERSCTAYTVGEKFAGMQLPVKAVGVTSGISGAFYLADSGDLLPFAVRVDLRTLTTDSSRRDAIVRSVLNTQSFPFAEFTVLEVKADAPVAQGGGEVPVSLAGTLMINGTPRLATFRGTAALSDGGLRIIVSTEINMRDFRVSPPSILGFVTVDELVQIYVEAVGTEAGN